jgi:O-antigen/teichoic acid export membrane protein
MLAGTGYATLALGVLTGPILARVLGADGRGQVAAVFIYDTFAVQVMSLGISLAVMRSMATGAADPRVILGIVVRFALMMTPIALATGVAIGVFVLDDVSLFARYAVVVFVGMAPMGIVGLGLLAFMLVRGDLRAQAITQSVPLIGVAAGTIVLAVAGALTVATYLVLNLVAGIACFVVGFRLVGVWPRRGGSLKPFLAFGLRGHVGSLANLATTRIDQVLVAAFISPSALGLYAIAATVSGLPLALGNAIGARAVGDMSTGTEVVDVERTAALSRVNLLLAIVCCGGLAIVAPVMVPLLYGPAFAGAVVPLLLLLPGIVFLAMSGIADSCLTVMGRPGANSWAQLVGLVVTAAGLALLLPRFGIAGAAITSSAAYGSRYGVQWQILRRKGLSGLVPGRADVVVLARAAARFVPRLRPSRPAESAQL